MTFRNFQKILGKERNIQAAIFRSFSRSLSVLILGNVRQCRSLLYGDSTLYQVLCTLLSRVTLYGLQSCLTVLQKRKWRFRDDE